MNAIEDLAYKYDPYVKFYNLYSKVATKFASKLYFIIAFDNLENLV